MFITHFLESGEDLHIPSIISHPVPTESQHTTQTAENPCGWDGVFGTGENRKNIS